MRTVKEVSELTGISVRTLHYYDETGLFKPSGYTEAGYRLYDDKALERLRQILFFREFDIPLGEIKRIMENPDFDRDNILTMQRAMLVKKRDRLNRLIDSIDHMQKGENDMEFGVFKKEEIEELYQIMEGKMTQEQKEAIIREYGSMEQHHEHFIKSAGSAQAQENFKKVVEWYGGKDSAMEAAVSADPEVFAAYQRRLADITARLAAKRGTDVDSFEVKSLVGEYDFVTKQLYQLKDARAMVLEQAELYEKNEKVAAAQDAQFGEGASAYLAEAFRAFYRRG